MPLGGAPIKLKQLTLILAAAIMRNYVKTEILFLIDDKEFDFFIIRRLQFLPEAFRL